MILVAACLGGGVTSAEAQQPAQSRSAAAAPVDVDAIIRAFTAKETEFARALNNYGFKRDAVIQTIGAGGQTTGEYRRASQFSFDDRGGRFERINYFPQSTLTEVSFTQEDLDDLGGVQPYALEASKLDQYSFTYVGKERIDELDLYVFDVAPKVMPKKVSERLFKGRVWVDDQDLQIVKVRGKGVPEGKQRFPIFETYREQVDGRYWFPTYTAVDDVLEFPGGQTTHLRMTVRYTDYRRFKGTVRIIEEGEPGIAPE
jgi:nitrogen regulatory protein PII